MIKLAIRLTKEFGVTTIPLSSFYQSKKDDKVLRFCFAKKEETLREAAETFTKFINAFNFIFTNTFFKNIFHLLSLFHFLYFNFA